jgi:hypothetical protein
MANYRFNVSLEVDSEELQQIVAAHTKSITRVDRFEIFEETPTSGYIRTENVTESVKRTPIDDDAPF